MEKFYSTFISILPRCVGFYCEFLSNERSAVRGWASYLLLFFLFNVFHMQLPLFRVLVLSYVVELVVPNGKIGKC